jgi:alkylation response protein AidB-like acyl-CoA dehydrogenase
MDFNFTSEQKLLRDSIIKFARGELNHEVIERDRAQTFPRDLWRQCAAVGLLGLPAPEEYGGVGADPLSCAIALEALGYGCRDGGLVFSICAHVLACVVPVWKHGSAAQKRRYLGKVCATERWSARTPSPNLIRARTPSPCAARRAHWQRRLAPQRQQDLHLQRTGGRRRRRVCGHRP